MKRLLSTFYVTTQGSYLHKEGETVVQEVGGKKEKQIPISYIDSIVCFGNVLCSPFLLGFCAERGVTVSFLTEYGRFMASVKGPVNGNVLLRRPQYRIAADEESTRKIAAAVISGKLANCRVVLSRTVRDHTAKVDTSALKKAISTLDQIIDKLPFATTTDELRGLEGQAAAKYFEVFNHLIISQKNDFVFNGRSRRPPLDEVNALLSFIYMLLMHDVRSALETVGLDTEVGFLHRDRSGRHSLALDMMEEFRPIMADRLVLSLINRGQVKKSSFTKEASGAVKLNEATRKTIFTEYHARKQEEITHPYFEEKMKFGLLFFFQAKLLVGHIKGELEGYAPFFWR